MAFIGGISARIQTLRARLTVIVAGLVGRICP